MKPPLPRGWKPRPLLGLVAAISMAWMLATVATAQNSQFAFDANGNLAAETVATIAPPQILAQPQNQIAAPGALASFIVIAANAQNLTYQWQFNGADIVGATSDTLVVTNVSASDAGDYSVVLNNGSGSVVSLPAVLMLDGDRDSLPDPWELAHFGSLNPQPGGDYDNDGVSNADEFIEGTNPADS